MVLGEMNYLVTGVSTTASKSSYDSYNSTMSGAAGLGLSSVAALVTSGCLIYDLVYMVLSAQHMTNAGHYH